MTATTTKDVVLSYASTFVITVVTDLVVATFLYFTLLRGETVMFCVATAIWTVGIVQLISAVGDRLTSTLRRRSAERRFDRLLARLQSDGMAS